MKRVLADLMDVGPEDEQFDARMSVLKEQVEHHVEEEEKELFPKVRKSLSEEELEELGDRMQKMFEKLEAQGDASKEIPDQTDAHVRERSGEGVRRAAGSLRNDRPNRGREQRAASSARGLGGTTLLVRERAEVQEVPPRRGRGGRAARPARRVLRPGVVSPRRAVPAAILAPTTPRAAGRAGLGRDVKTPEELERLRGACRAAARVLRVAGEAVRPGITTDALDEIAHAETLRQGGYPSPLNYRGFPKSICTSVNEVICHGIPDSRPLEDGDIVNLDITVFLDGMHGDCSATFLVARWTPPAAARPGRARVPRARHRRGATRAADLDIGHAIEAHAAARLRRGARLLRPRHRRDVPHLAPDPAPLRRDGRRRIMEKGMTFTIEPMITEGHWQDLLGRWVDRDHRRPEALGAVRAHHRGERRRRGDPDRRGSHRVPSLSAFSTRGRCEGRPRASARARSSARRRPAAAGSRTRSRRPSPDPRSARSRARRPPRRAR